MEETVKQEMCIKAEREMKLFHSISLACGLGLVAGCIPDQSGDVESASYIAPVATPADCTNLVTIPLYPNNRGYFGEFRGGKYVAPGMNNANFDVTCLDLRGLEGGDFAFPATLTVFAYTGKGKASASFDIFPGYARIIQNETIPTRSIKDRSLAKAHDVRPDSSRRMQIRVNGPGVYLLTASGNWFSKKNLTNDYWYDITLR